MSTLVRQIELTLDGQPAADELYDAVTEIKVHRLLSAPSVVEITMIGGALALQSLDLLGTELELRSSQSDLSLCLDVTTVRHHHDSTGIETLHIRAFDRLNRLRSTHSLHVFESATVDDIASAVLEGADLSLTTSGAGGVTTNRLQHDENDLVFLTRILDASGLSIVVNGTDAQLVDAENPASTTELRLGDELTELTRTGTVDGTTSAVRAVTWDLELAETVDAVAASSATVARLDLGEASPQHHGRVLFDAGSRNRADAERSAQAALDRSSSSAARFDGLALGCDALAPGTRCTFLSHDGSELGEHTLAEVELRINGAGAITEFTTHRTPPPLTSSSGTVVTRAIVAEVDDPAGRGRVRVTLTSRGEITTPWLDVALPGASHTRGLIAVPEPGDIVVVALPGSDIGSGIVLGSVLGTDGPPRPVAKAGRIDQHVWHSSRNQYVALNDRAGSIVARNRSGSRLSLRSNLVELHSEADLLIAAPGKTIRIQAAAVEFEQVT